MESLLFTDSSSHICCRNSCRPQRRTKTSRTHRITKTSRTHRKTRRTRTSRTHRITRISRTHNRARFFRTYRKTKISRANKSNSRPASPTQTKIYSQADSMNRATEDVDQLECSYRGELDYLASTSEDALYFLGDPE